MRIGDSEIAVSLGEVQLLLRPSLRCAYRLERRYSGFEPLARTIANGTVHVLADVMMEAAPGSFKSREQAEAAIAADLANLDNLIAQLLSFIFTLCGADQTAPANEPKSETVSDSLTLSDFYLRLFRIATGWLGWPPEAAWNATPADIMESYKGRTELLNAIFGGTSDETSSTPTPNHSGELDHEGLEALRSMGGV